MDLSPTWQLQLMRQHHQNNDGVSGPYLTPWDWKPRSSNQIMLFGIEIWRQSAKIQSSEEHLTCSGTTRKLVEKRRWMGCSASSKAQGLCIKYGSNAHKNALVGIILMSFKLQKVNGFLQVQWFPNSWLFFVSLQEKNVETLQVYRWKYWKQLQRSY